MIKMKIPGKLQNRDSPRHSCLDACEENGFACIRLMRRTEGKGGEEKAKSRQKQREGNSLQSCDVVLFHEVDWFPTWPFIRGSGTQGQTNLKRKTPHKRKNGVPLLLVARPQKVTAMMFK
jgi:hypothetical protein